MRFSQKKILREDSEALEFHFGIQILSFQHFLHFIQVLVINGSRKHKKSKSKCVRNLV